jgi:hypothetical protein
VHAATGTSACGACLFSQTPAVAPIEAIVIGSQIAYGPSLGACLLATAGSAADACAAGVDELGYCGTYSCAACGQTAQQACYTSVQAAGGPCAATTSSATSACNAYSAILSSCQSSLGTAASLTTIATALCGAGSTDGGSEQ